MSKYDKVEKIGQFAVPLTRDERRRLKQLTGTLNTFQGRLYDLEKLVRDDLSSTLWAWAGIVGDMYREVQRVLELDQEWQDMDRTETPGELQLNCRIDAPPGRLVAA